MACISAVYPSFGIQADALTVKAAWHFGHRICVVVTRRSSAGGIWYPQCGQGVASDALTFSKSIFFRAGIRGFYSEARLPFRLAFFRMPHFLRIEPAERELLNRDRLNHQRRNFG